MPDLSQPVTPGVIIGSIVFIALCVGAGLALVAYYRKQQRK
ncbi:hypothetical protein [Nitratifractor sp.]